VAAICNRAGTWALGLGRARAAEGRLEDDQLFERLLSDGLPGFDESVAP